MWLIIETKTGRIMLIYAIYETESRYYLGDWQFFNKSEIEKILEEIPE